MRTLLIVAACAALVAAEEGEEERLRRSNEQLKQRLAELGGELRNLEDRTNHLGARVDELMQRVMEQTARASRAIAERERMAAELADLKRGLAEAVKVNADLAATCETLRAELKAANRIAADNAEWGTIVTRDRERETMRRVTTWFVRHAVPRNLDALGDVLENARMKDAWGNPIVLIRKERYALPVEVTNAAGAKVEVRARTRPGGAYYNADSYQVLCLGPDGLPGTEDDITNFETEETER